MPLAPARAAAQKPSGLPDRVKTLVPSVASPIRHSEGACKTWVAATPALSALKGSACQRYHGNLERRSRRHARTLPKDKFLLACIGTFRDYHLLFDEQAAQIFNIAERAGKIGARQYVPSLRGCNESRPR
jgi:hypothetical protein